MKCKVCGKSFTTKQILRFIFSAEFVQMLAYLPLVKPILIHGECFEKVELVDYSEHLYFVAEEERFEREMDLSI